ncbi:protein FAM149B1 isoform X1 [Syngnathoides biaculeatus]|uniref:protein FAM149B1 isoform X1 n=1 Tax=Syngnathoides biaculeatus TaxID=300417 RepID=UPI002ADD9562|nr:protein FAM149B1 isoform X1 [Syngnathoides biaculeatus]
MISRYNRRPVSHKIEIRGLSRSSLDHHPLPEEADHQTPPCPLDDVEQVVSIRNCPSDCPTVISLDSSRSWSGIHSSTGTAVSTERSSVFSWGYDEFDKAASRQVQQMFEEIDKELYEGKGSGGGILPGLQEECQQWATSFPHLRIVGTQLVCPSDEGFQWYATSGTMGSSYSRSPSTSQQVIGKSSEKDDNNMELNVLGRSATLLKSNSTELNGPLATPRDSRSRVIEVEGHMEEYLAFDSISLEDEKERTWPEPCPRRRCMPPVSPYRCRRQAVLDHLFDDLWRQLVGCMSDLLHRQWEHCTSGHEKLSGNLTRVQQSSLTLFSTLPSVLPKFGQSHALPPTPPAPGLALQKSRGSKHKSRRKPQKQKRPPSAGRVLIGGTQHNLNDLIMIQSIPLPQRNLAALDRTQDPEERRPLRPSSGTAPAGKPRPRRNLEQSSSSLTRPPQSARRRNLVPRTLQPLVPSLGQSGAARSMEEVIRVTRLPTASDHLMSPLFALSRNTLLPPIGAGDAESSPLGQQSKAAQRQKGFSSRAHSALNDEVGSSIPRDRFYPLDVFSRPSTTHTYRSDTPYRRSFTVLDSIGQGRPGRASVATDSLGIGVTGVSLGIRSSSLLDSFSHHPLGRWRIRDEDEETDFQTPLPAPLVPLSIPPRSHSRGGISSRPNRPGL